MTKIRTRYAPSPTGRMHVGNLRTALYAYLIAKHEGGDFLLRIEDTDQERYVEGATEIIYRTLEETGLVHDEGSARADATACLSAACRAIRNASSWTVRVHQPPGGTDRPRTPLPRLQAARKSSRVVGGH